MLHRHRDIQYSSRVASHIERQHPLEGVILHEPMVDIEQVRAWRLPVLVSPRGLPGTPCPTLAFALERAQLGSLPGASLALAAHVPDESVEIIAPIVIGDLVPGLDVLDRPNLDHVLDKIDFRVRPAGMIDIAGPIASAGAVDGPAIVDLEQIAGVELFGVLGADLLAAISNDELALLDRGASKEAQAGLGSADPKMTRR